MLFGPQQRDAEKPAKGPVPDAAGRGAVVLKVNAEIRTSADGWKVANQSNTIKKIAYAFSRVGELSRIEVTVADSGIGTSKAAGETCQVCGWTHDAGFTQIIIEKGDVILLRGVLSEIVRVVHQAHEKGFSGLSTKDEALEGVCGGYNNPCKAFDDLKLRSEYKRLFDTSRRGFITLRCAVGRNRNSPRNDGS